MTIGSSTVLSISLCVVFSALVATAASAEIESLGQPCRAKNVLSGRIVTDRKTGREMLGMVDMNETTGAELLFVDFARNKGTKYHAPAGSGSWALNEVPGDRLVVGTFYDGKFMVFDLKKMEFVKTIEFPGESYIWNLAMGNDGRIYGGTYGSGKLGALDLKTYEVEDLGNPAPPNMYCRNVSALPDGRILCQFGEEKNTALIFDPGSKKFEPVPKQLEGISSGLTWHGYFLAGAKAFKGESLAPVDLPFPAPPADKGSWYVDTYPSTEDRLILRQDNAIYTYKNGDSALRLVADLYLHSGRLLGASNNGNVIGIRGQDYFVLKPGDKSLKLKRIPVESDPRPTHFLRCDEKGILWGGSTFGQTLCWLDPKTRKYENTSTISNAGGEVYDVAFHDGKVYSVAYVRGEVGMYDPGKPWDQLTNTNPKMIASLTGQGYIRPIAGVMVGPDGKLYSGWMAKYGTYGGAVAITDPETGETRLIENPLGKMAVSGLAVDEKYAYVGTDLNGNGLPSQKGISAKFGMIELATGKVEFEQTSAEWTNVMVPGYDGQSGRAIVSVNWKLRLFDVKKREFIELPEDTPGYLCHSCVLRDGRLYYTSDKSIVCLDVRTGKHEILAQAPAKSSNVALGPSGTVYFSSGPDVYVVK